MLHSVNYYLDVATPVDPDELLNATEVAQIIGLTNPRGISVYRARHKAFPAPVIDKGNCVLWLRSDVEKWAQARRA